MTYTTLYSAKAITIPHRIIRYTGRRWIQRGGGWVGLHPAQTPPLCIKYNTSSFTGVCNAANHHFSSTFINGQAP